MASSVRSSAAIIPAPTRTPGSGPAGSVWSPICKARWFRRIHMNTRHIANHRAAGSAAAQTSNPMIPDEADTAAFHAALKAVCDWHDADYYPRFKAWCDEYFFIKHRGEARGVGGIFYDYLDTGDWEAELRLHPGCRAGVPGGVPPRLVRRQYERELDRRAARPSTDASRALCGVQSRLRTEAPSSA